MTKLEIQLLSALRGLLAKDGHDRVCPYRRSSKDAPCSPRCSAARAAVKDASAQVIKDHDDKLSVKDALRRAALPHCSVLVPSRLPSGGVVPCAGDIVDGKCIRCARVAAGKRAREQAIAKHPKGGGLLGATARGFAADKAEADALAAFDAELVAARERRLAELDREMLADLGTRAGLNTGRTKS